MNKRIVWLVSSLTVVSFIFCAALFFPKNLAPKILPVLWPVEDFQLSTQDGKDFSLSQLKGKIWVADFVFTTCGSICPKMTKNMASLHRSYLLEADVAFVSISVNPEYDTPEILRKYVKKWQVDTKSWNFLTGKREDIQALAVQSFKLGDMQEPVFHSDKFALVDHKGFVRGYYSGVEKEEIEKLFLDIALLLQEKRRDE